MRIRRSEKYKNYGPTPRNEYTTANTEKNTSSIAASDHDTQADDTTHKNSLRKLHLQYPAISGLKRTVKVNGWRAELAAQHDESMNKRRY